MTWLDPVSAAITWLVLTLLSKWLGKKYVPETAPGRDTLLDIITLLMATQVALALGDTPLVSSLVDWLLARVNDIPGGEIPAKVVGIIVGIACGFFMIKKGKRFAKFDEEAFAWKELFLFSVNFLLLMQIAGWLRDASAKVAEYFTTPVGSFAVKAINAFFSIDF